MRSDRQSSWKLKNGLLKAISSGQTLLYDMLKNFTQPTKSHQLTSNRAVSPLFRREKMTKHIKI